MIKVEMSEPKFVYAPEVNDITNRWGVCSLPRMWREINGDFIVRFNGEADDGYLKELTPSLYFKSSDMGNTWQAIRNGSEIYDISVINGINPPYLRRKNGEIIAISQKANLQPISGIKFEKEYTVLDGVNMVRTYQYGNIPESCKGIELVCYKDGKKCVKDIDFIFPEREVAVNYKAKNLDSTYSVIPEYLKTNIFVTPYMTGLTELDDSTLVALTVGQNPTVFDRKCQEVYMVESTDNGITWRKRSVVASETRKYPNGYSGDGGEVSLTRAENGNLICAMRMEPVYATMLTVSTDNGYHWSQPEPVADSGVTPHVIALADGIVVLIYGRPGVHFKVSQDNGITWSESYSIIGKTLTEEQNSGREYMDFMYYKSVSYSNTFIEKISDNSILVLYNANEKFDDNAVERHKAAYVRKITVKRSNV